MIKIPDPVLIFYIVASIAGFLFRFIKDGVFKELSFKPLISNIGFFLAIFLPFVGLLFLAQHFSLAAGTTIPYFAGAAVFSYLLSGIKMPSYLRGLLLAGAAVALTLLVKCDFVALASVLTGLLTVKLAENIAYGPDSNFDDLLPPFIWLASVMWLNSIDLSVKELGLRAALILGVMATSIFMRLVQGPFVAVGNSQDDKIMVKRVVLSATAGLAVLLVVVKLLNMMAYQNLAIFCGAAYFVTYLYKDLNGEERYSLATQQALRLLIFTGLLTLLAMRFFGTFGLLALAPAAMVAPLSSAALFPGVFFASRALLQVYLQHFNLNVTGINLNHTYASAAQYGGFLLGIAILLLLKEKIERRVLLALVLALCIVSPVLSNFILHSEASCSLFIAAIVSCFLLAVIGPALQRSKSNGAENLALMPVLMISSGILTSGLLEAGNSATIAVKTTVLSYGIVFVLIFTFACWFFFRKKGDGPLPASSGSSDGA